MVIAVMTVALLILLYIGAIFTGRKRAEAKLNKKEADAAMWETFMLLFITLIGFTMVVLVLLHNQELMAVGFAKTFRYLEVLTRGR